MTSCTAKLRPFPQPDATELRCELEHGGQTELTPVTGHQAVLRDYAYPGSRTVINWEEGDRRTFRGEWSRCPQTMRRPRGGTVINVSCVLPAGHHGRCAP